MEHVATPQTLKMDHLNNKNFQGELHSCRHFLVYCDFEKTRLNVFGYAPETLLTKFVEETLDKVLEKLNCAGNVNFAFGFI